MAGPTACSMGIPQVSLCGTNCLSMFDTRRVLSCAAAAKVSDRLK